MNTHRWKRATIADPEYGRICACGDLKDQQSLRCRACYADERRKEEKRLCGCGGCKSRNSRQCRTCADRALLGNQHAAGRSQPQWHPWRKPRISLSRG